MQSPTLLTLKREIDDARTEQSLERHKAYKDVKVGDHYQTSRYGITSSVWVAEVKTKDVVLKRAPEAKDSFTENRTRFDKFYTHVPAV